MKGLFVGSLVGGVLVSLGLAQPGAWVAFGAAALVAALVATIAGKKVWEKDGFVQLMLKAVAGALVGPGLMWLVRRFLVMPLPELASLPGVGQLPGMQALQGVSLTVGGFAMTSLAIVAAVLGGFYDLDNTAPLATAAPAARKGARPKSAIDPELAALTGLDASEIEEAESATADAATRSKKR